jgi:two-component system CheB/CheR fusion protein
MASKSTEDILKEVEELKSKLAEATETIEAIRTGQVDALVVNIDDEHKIYTLKTADHTFRVFIEKMSEGAVTLTVNGDIIYSNSSFAEMVDLPLEKVIGTNFNQYVPDKFKEAFKKLFQEAFTKDSKGEISLYNKDKKLIPFLISLTMLNLDEREAISIILTDLCMQKDAENELKLKNELLEEAERLSKIGSWQWDLKSNTIARSNELYAIYGLDPGTESYSFVDLDRIHPDDRERYMNEAQEAIKNKESFSINARIIAKNGEEKSVLVRGRVLRENGEAFKVVGSTQDVTEIKKIEDELKQKNEQLITAQKITTLLNHELEDTVQERTKELLLSKEHFRFLADNIPQVVWQAEGNGSMVFFNKHWYEYTGLTPEETYGWKWQQAIHPDDLNESLKAWEHSIETGEPFLFEHRFKHHNGYYRWHIGRAQAMKNERNEVEMWIGTNADIHDQKMAIEKKDEFIGMASHELKTPLTSAKAYLQLLERNVTDKSNKTYVEKANKHIGKLNELISDLLDVTKIQAGKLVLTKSEFDFDAFVYDCVEGFQHTSKTHQIIIEGKTDCKITADKHRVEQVLINFLSNAIKYSPKANKVLVNITKEEKTVSVSVRDYGIGIPDEKIQNVFQKFYRVEGVSKHFEGLGIGLFISAEIIKRHDGKVFVESEEGQGSVFTFSLPC